jgi:predicted kinase
MAGLPGVGKDTWIQKNVPELPVISLDALRDEMGVEPGDNQNAVVVRAREQARVYLRRKQPFVFNATNLNTDLREYWTELFRKYHARLRFVYLEVPFTELLRRNKVRPAAKRVPEEAIRKMMRKWELPGLSEAHVVGRIHG